MTTQGRKFKFQLCTLMYLITLQSSFRTIAVISELILVFFKNSVVDTIWAFFASISYSIPIMIYSIMLFIWSGIITEFTDSLNKTIIAARIFNGFGSLFFLSMCVLLFVNLVLQEFQLINDTVALVIWYIILYGVVPLYLIWFCVNTILLISLAIIVFLRLKKSREKNNTNFETTQKVSESLKKIGIALVFILISFLIMLIGAGLLFYRDSMTYALFVFTSIPEWLSAAAVIITFWPWKILVPFISNKEEESQNRLNMTSDLSIQILKHPDYLKAFKEFCSDEKIAGNIDVWLRIEKFKTMHDRHDRRHAAIKIYEECLEGEGTQIVNITENHKLGIKLALEGNEELPREIFDALQLGKWNFYKIYICSNSSSNARLI